MRNRPAIMMIATILIGTTLWAGWAGALPEKGAILPSFAATDIRGNKVDLDKIVAESPDMVILYFFSTATGQEIALRLGVIDMLYGRDKVRIIAFGVQEDQAALQKFADELKIEYFLLPKEQVDAQTVYGPFQSLPLTVVVKNDKTVVKVIRGSGETAAAVLTSVADTYLMQGKSEEALALANKAKENGEDPNSAGQVAGFALTQAGKLDDAEKEFGVIKCDEGLAKVALERGDPAKAIQIADQAGPENAYAQTVKGTALMRSGKLDEAAQTFDAASQKPATDWQSAEALNGLGRVMQEKGATPDAMATYEKAIALDPYNVVALSNQAAAFRAEGDLDKAAQTLEKAKAIRNDDLVVTMLKQVQAEIKDAADVKRTELIRQQITDLAKRYQEMKASGADKAADTWSTRPLVLAFLPSNNQAAVFFERAGTDIVLRRELITQVQSAGPARVVEREMLDKLLQELNLGSSEVADKATQLQLGKVLSAKYLGFIDFVQTGPDILIYLRLVDTETTEVAHQIMRNLKDAKDITGITQNIAKEALDKIMAEREIKGIIAEAPADDAIIINLGKNHGVKTGQQFTLLDKGEPIDIPGRGVIAYRSKPVGIIEVTELEDEYATCKVIKKNDGIQIARDMKIKETK